MQENVAAAMRDLRVANGLDMDFIEVVQQDFPARTLRRSRVFRRNITRGASGQAMGADAHSLRTDCHGSP